MKTRTVNFCWISTLIVLAYLIIADFLIKRIGNIAILWITITLVVIETLVYYVIFKFPHDWLKLCKSNFYYLRQDLENSSTSPKELHISAYDYKNALIKMKDVYEEDVRFSEAYLQRVKKKLERRLSPMNRDRVYKKYLASMSELSRLKIETMHVDEELDEVKWFEHQLINLHPMPPASFS